MAASKRLHGLQQALGFGTVHDDHSIGGDAAATTDVCFDLLESHLEP